MSEIPADQCNDAIVAAHGGAKPSTLSRYKSVNEISTELEWDKMQRLTCGVAIITFNGLRYIAQQLDSILAQTRPVEHIVISDDGSTDGTVEFLEAWVKHCPIRVTLIRNEKQQGLIKNFEKAVSAVNADVVFSCDQDDIWIRQKVALLAEAFENRPEVTLVHTDAILVDAQGRDMKTTLLGELEVTEAEKRTIRTGDAFSVFCRRNLVTGATAAFRRTLLQLALPLPASLYHDAWLASMAAATGTVCLMDISTIHYRQHGSNVVGVKKLDRLTKLRHFYWTLRNKERYSATVDSNVSVRAAVYSRLSSSSAVAISSLALAKQALEFAEFRRALPENYVLRTGSVLRNAIEGQYAKFSYEPWLDAARDILSR